MGKAKGKGGSAPSAEAPKGGANKEELRDGELKGIKGKGKPGGASASSAAAAAATKKPPKRKGGSGGAREQYLYAAGVLVVAVVAIAFQQLSADSSGSWPSPQKEAAVATSDIEEAASRRERAKATKQRAEREARAAPPREMTQQGRIDPGCVDDNESCESWAKSGECDRNKAFMHSNCRASCHICNGGKPKPKKTGDCDDSNTNCATWAAIGECQSNPGFMLKNCPVTCKMCQSETCRDELTDCAERARGGVESNYSETLRCYYEPELVEKCAWTCGACKEHRFDKPACKRRAGVQPSAVPGSVNQIFEGILAARGDKVNVLSRDPWVVTVEDFLSPEECEDIKAAGSNSGSSWERSKAGDGVQASRTSSTAWCKGRCLQHPTVRATEQRVSELMGGIPMENAEPMQVLRYETGQFYKVHHDQNSPRSSAWGPRMFTVFMYIGDGYEGGLTHFPRLNLTIPAKKGAACVWTSVLDSDPYQRDDRTDHQSLPVESGVKFGVNYWIHMFPFRPMQGGGCDNQAYIQNWY